MEQNYAATNFVKVSSPKERDTKTIRFLIMCGLISMLIFVVWFIKPEHIGYGPLFWLLSFGLLFKLVKMLHEWYHYWSLSVPVAPELKTTFTVDILTTYCPGEPHEMLINTLKAMIAIRYPHTNYLCDEANDPMLKKICDELGIIHVTRTLKINAKAGNINNALKQATGDLCIVLDPDHIPVPEFIDRVLPYFEDEGVGYVQCVQGYYNQDESIIARGAAEQTYHFYGPMMMCMNTYGTVQAIGANCTFRRKALDSIGGHAAGLAEDMHTAMQLHAKGWRSLYIPEMLTKGLVPATLSSYYKQQLKWSRGTFELLFRTYPSLFKHFTWRQKIHYLCIPLYFLFGVVNLIDIIIPLFALFMAQVPWEVDINNFALLFIPLCSLSMVIRLFAQRWLLEKHERGLHLSGGILRTATWWIFLVGFIYSIFNVNVPYIPTPKEDAHENYWKLSIPNFMITLICSVIILYGLSIDWTPYSIAMAFYSCINAIMLGFIVMMSQQKLLKDISQKIHTISGLHYLANAVSWLYKKSQQFFYKVVQNGPVVLLIALALVFVSYTNIDTELELSEMRQEKFFGGFYNGISFKPEQLTETNLLENKIERKFDIMPIHDSLGKDITETKKSLHLISTNGYIPMICWALPKNEQGETDWQAILDKKYDFFLEQYAAQLRVLSSPVFINPELSNTVSSSPSTQKKGWQYLYTYFYSLGISNITWVWTPPTPDFKICYPGSIFVDWVGVKILNYTNNQKSTEWYSFKELYSPYKSKVKDLQKPVMITELGSLNGETQSEWLKRAFEDIRNEPAIKGTLLYNQEKQFAGTKNNSSALNFNFSITDKTIQILENKFSEELFKEKPFFKNDFQNNRSLISYKSKFVKGKPGNFELLINGKPYYIRGVAYNTGHDWRDGNMPLTRRRLEKDFKDIKDMGANTIRRYGNSIYDKNVLNVAREYDLKVVYGFWFDPKIDYYRDSIKVQKYIEEVENRVLEFRDHSSVLAWSLGNETWGLLKHRYSKPYLTKVRDCYIKMIEKMAERVHELDPNRPVFSCMEHEKYQLPGELVALHDGAPSVDVIGVNSYYKEQISVLNSDCYRFDSLRPYLVSEFGPRGYWNPDYNKAYKGSQVEDNDDEKALWYKEQWSNYVIAKKGYNVGGFAYCWHDRLEGSYTWFGISDYKGRLKPSYYTLKEIWTKEKTVAMPNIKIEIPTVLLPGKEYDITTVTTAAPGLPLKYEWLLLKDEYLGSIDNIKLSETGRSIKINIPTTPSNYRLYLFVSDQDKKVTTTSVPIRVY